ncbi:MAG: exodeoxyribonuclease VII small subunit [Leptolinea sp.]|nr:exodeoxyribonuclease VII small subunit [Leptolinea sp.]
MSKTKTTVTQTAVEDLSYEEAYAELEGIVALLEQEQTDLESTIAWFERGQKLAKHCQQLLDKAELRVRTLGVDSPIIEADEE